MNYRMLRVFGSTAAFMMSGALLGALAPPPACAQVATAPYKVRIYCYESRQYFATGLDRRLG